MLSPLLLPPRHPLPFSAFFRHSLALTYAFPPAILEPLLPPGLLLDTHRDYGYLAVVMVESERLRPSCAPSRRGQHVWLAGYRLFVRYRQADGRTLRGLKVLRTDTNSRTTALVGNLLTGYRYHAARFETDATPEALRLRVRTADGAADLEVLADLGNAGDALPPGSPFADPREARRYAAPLRYTFDDGPEPGSLVLIEAVRRRVWRPHPVRVEVRECGFLARPPFDRSPSPLLAGAYYTSGVDYGWKRGVRVPVDDNFRD